MMFGSIVAIFIYWATILANITWDKSLLPCMIYIVYVMVKAKCLMNDR